MQSINELIESHGLGQHSAAIQSLVRRCVLASEGIGDPNRGGAAHSQLGGLPQVPRGFQWPHRNGLPLAFLGMIRLSELPSTGGEELPARGLLYFWYDAFGDQPWGFDPADRDAWRVEFVADEGVPTELLPFPTTELPKSYCEMMPGKHGHFELCPLRFSAGVSLPDVAWLKEYRADLAWLEDLEDEYCSLVDDLIAQHEPQHMLLGYPNPQQNSMELECQLASNGLYCGDSTGYNDSRASVLEAGAGDWRLLFQIDTDESGPGWMWGDAGMLYFWIRKQDLAERDFSNVWMILQCG